MRVLPGEWSQLPLHDDRPAQRDAKKTIPIAR